MSEQPPKNRGPFASLWPWPGVALMALLAVWFFYMSAAADMNDVSNAFLGLGIVASLVALLGLRKANLRPRGANLPAERGGRRGQAGRKRSAIADAVAEPAFEADQTGQGGIAVVAAQAEADETPEEAYGQSVTPFTAIPQDGRQRFTNFAEVADAIQQLEILINREKAERGAVLARLTAHDDDDEEEDDEDLDEAAYIGRDLTVALEERLNNYLTIPAFNAAMNQRVFPQITQLIEKALRERIGPDSLKEQVDSAAAATTSVEGDQAPVTFALQLAEARQALEAHIEDVQKDRKSMREDIRAARKLADRAAKIADTKFGEGGDNERDLLGVVKDLRTARRTDRERLKALELLVAGTPGKVATSPDAPGLETRLEKAIADANARLDEALSGLGGAGEAVLAVPEGGASDAAGPARRQLQAIRREVDETRAEADRRMGEIGTTVEDVRKTTERLGRRIAAAERAQAELAARIEALSGVAPEGPPPSTGETTGEEVDALRNALSTIIEQNRAIKAQQEMLSARFEPPAKASSPASSKD